MSWVAVAIGGSALLGYMGSQNQADAAGSAADQSRQASDTAIAEQRRQFDLNQANQQPWLTAGTGAVNQLAAGLAPGGRFSTTFSPADFSNNMDPGYGFRLSEGLKALDRSASARGGLLSGSALKGITRYGQDFASNEYNNAFNRFQTTRTNQLAPLQSLAGVGQTAANQVGATGANTAGAIGQYGVTNAANVGNAGLSAANARASSYGGVTNMLGMAAFNPWGRNVQYGAPNAITMNSDPWAGTW